VTTQAQQNYNTPVLCSTWTADGSAYLSGCADKVLRRWDLGSGQSIPVGQHDAPIKEVAWVSELNVAVTGSWDKTIRVWDGRTSTNVAQATMNVSERIYCMDAVSSYVAAGCADNKIHIFDLRKGAQALKVSDSPLKKQLRYLTFAGDRRCFAVASIEGRAAIEYLQDTSPSSNFAFKCHRDGNNVYAVNTMCFHPTLFSTLVTGGSDGTLSIWDKDARQRLKVFLISLFIHSFSNVSI
jgi:mRNA export factor